jgi:hypothetical protein
VVAVVAAAAAEKVVEKEEVNKADEVQAHLASTLLRVLMV